jgi:hypothetical protein
MKPEEAEMPKDVCELLQDADRLKTYQKECLEAKRS